MTPSHTHTKPLVRRATLEDVEAAAHTNAAAFIDYNWTKETVQEEGRYDRLVAINRIFYSEVVIPNGLMWVTDDVTALSAWARPNFAADASQSNPAVLLADMRGQLAELAGDKAEAFFTFEEWLDPYQPKAPGYYLGALAVHPDFQGQGLARLVLEPGLKRAKREGLPIYLDTSTTQNKSMYEHFGFRVTHEVEMPHGAFTSWLMEKPA